MRCRFLVLDGPSLMGKTVFAMSLVPPTKALELNCAVCPEPDLKEYDPLAIDLILFDEANPTMVLQQRKLFQAPDAFVGLGSSLTKCHAYKVWSHRTKLVIASNNWATQLNTLPPEYRTLLTANSVYVQSTRPLYV